MEDDAIRLQRQSPDVQLELNVLAWNTKRNAAFSRLENHTVPTGGGITKGRTCTTLTSAPELLIALGVTNVTNNRTMRTKTTGGFRKRSKGHDAKRRCKATEGNIKHLENRGRGRLLRPLDMILTVGVREHELVVAARERLCAAAHRYRRPLTEHAVLHLPPLLSRGHHHRREAEQQQVCNNKRSATAAK